MLKCLDNFEDLHYISVVGLSKKVIITGSRGIAAGLAISLSASGAKVYLLGGELTDSQSLARENSNIVGFSPIDLRDEISVEEGFVEGVNALGGLTDVVAIVGGSGRTFGDGPLHEMTKDGWDKTLELNLTTAFLTAREGIKHLTDNGGSITLTSSVLSVSPSPQFFQTHAYAVAKAGINGLVTALSAAYIHRGIRVNGVMPGLVATPMAARAATDPTIAAFTEKKQPLVNAQLPVDPIVDAYLYLLNNSAVTGQMLVVDGGWSVISDI